MYESERGKKNGKICAISDSCNDTVVRTNEWIGKIALIYPSDYGYASTDIRCSSNIMGAESTCKNNNWLNVNRFYWMLSPYASSSNSASMWVVHSDSSINVSGVYYTGEVRPSLYLSSNVYITGGDGNTTPFKLSVG